MITLRVKKAHTFWEQTKGLLGTPVPYPLLLQTPWGIHTFGMQYPLDIVILDKTNTVVALKENLKPNRIFLWNPKYDQILELPKGFVKKENIKIGDQITTEIRE